MKSSDSAPRPSGWEVALAGLGAATIGVVWAALSATRSIDPAADMRAGYLMLVFGGLSCLLAWIS